MLAIIVLIVMGLASVIGSEVLSIVVAYLAIVLISAAVILGGFYALFWRTRT
jgi:hypothetical protein